MTSKLARVAVCSMTKYIADHLFFPLSKSKGFSTLLLENQRDSGSLVLGIKFSHWENRINIYFYPKIGYLFIQKKIGYLMCSTLELINLINDVIIRETWAFLMSTVGVWRTACSWITGYLFNRLISDYGKNWQLKSIVRHRDVW